jgi:hypothetical protein
MKPEIWGPPIWLFIHALASKIKDEMYVSIGYQLFNIIKRITAFLPCPHCSQHATSFLSSITPNTIKTKQDLIRVLYLFHNSVNVRKGKTLYNFSELNIYENTNLQQAYNNFRKVYHNNGNMNLLAETFQRNLVLKDLKIWLSQHSNKFDYSNKPDIPKIETVVADAVAETTTETVLHLEVIEMKNANSND